MSARRHTAVAVVGVALLAACSKERAPVVDSARPAPAAATTPVPWTVSSTGIGSIRVGQSRATVLATLGDSAAASATSSESCGYLRVPQLPAGVALMLDGETIVRVDVDSGAVRTAEGAGVGDTEASVLAKYAGRVTTQPHKYTGPKGHYLVVDDPADSLHRIVFETDGAVVTEYRAGNRAAVDLVEGCS